MTAPPAAGPGWLRRLGRDEPVIVGAAASALVSVGAITATQATAWTQVAADLVAVATQLAAAAAVRRRVRPHPAPKETPL